MLLDRTKPSHPSFSSQTLREELGSPFYRERQKRPFNRLKILHLPWQAVQCAKLGANSQNDAARQQRAGQSLHCQEHAVVWPISPMPSLQLLLEEALQKGVLLPSGQHIHHVHTLY